VRQFQARLDARFCIPWAGSGNLFNPFAQSAAAVDNRGIGGGKSALEFGGTCVREIGIGMAGSMGR
jgi:hypothetical protein